MSRVAIVGGGIAGSLCALVLRSRGRSPTIFDRGARGLGGRLAGGADDRDSGAHFLRASDPSSQFAQVLQMLASEGVVAPWTGRMGLLGSRGGGFLAAEVAQGALVTTMGKADSDSDGGGGASDAGDFCGFISGRRADASPMYVGVPSNAAVCERIAALGGIPVRRCAVAAATLAPGGWRLEAGDGLAAEHGEFDALVLASHDPTLAAATVAALADTAPADAAARMRELAAGLRRAREHAQPVFSLSARFAEGSLGGVPFDAATVPGSVVLQFVARDASKPGRPGGAHAAEGELLSAVSTSAYARAVLDASADDVPEAAAGAAAHGMTAELARLLAPFGAPPPLRASAKRWRAGFCDRPLGIDEGCVTLEPWSLAICGDFLRARPSPLEAAAESGLVAGERVATW